MTFYGTVSGYRTYHTARGRNVQGHPDSQIEVVLLKASEWLDDRFRARFAGIKRYNRETQVREWPRTDAVDVNGWSINADVVPVEVENATYEAAYREHLAAGSLNKDFTPSAYSQVSITGALHVQYLQNRDVPDVQTRFAEVEQQLARVLTSNAGMTGGVVGKGVR